MTGSIEITNRRPSKTVTITETVNNPVVSEDPTANQVIVDDATINTVLYSDKINNLTFLNKPGYIHDQLSPSSTWVVPHNLSFLPNVAVVNESGELVHGDVRYTNPNLITIYFTSAFTGKVYLS